MRHASSHPAIVCVALGLLLALLQVTAAAWTAPGASPVSAYGRYFGWDSVWYADIAQHGYRAAEDPYPGHRGRTMDNVGELSNGGFFPGYPLVGGLLIRVLPVPVELAMLLAAQIAAAGAWIYLLLLLRRWKVRPVTGCLAVLAVFAYPLSFFLVSAYSESTFLFALLGYLYWSGAKGRTAFWVAAAHGMLLSATRLLGLPLVILPLLQAWWEDEKPFFAVSASRLWRHRDRFLLVALAALGAAAVFVWALIVFGRWDYYFFIQKKGWEVSADYAYPVTHVLDVLFPKVGHGGPMKDRLMTAAGLWSLLLLTAADMYFSWRYKGVGSPVRKTLLAAAWLLSVLSVAGLASKGLLSMSRYMIVVLVPAALAAVHLLTALPVNRPWVRRGLTAAFLIVCAVSFGLQLHLSAKFAQGGWVA